MSEWQPIATAPRDGTVVILLGKPHGLHGVGMGVWRVRFKMWDFVRHRLGCNALDSDFTHWMPCPSPPPPTSK